MSNSNIKNCNIRENDNWDQNLQYYQNYDTKVNANDFEFQQNVYYEEASIEYYHQPESNYTSPRMRFFYEPQSPNADIYQDYFNKSTVNNRTRLTSLTGDEPPLLEELEIYPEQILSKLITVLNPFHHNTTFDSDLGGPLLLYFCLAVIMFLSGGIFNFGPRDSHISEQALLVCTAHIHWDPEFCDVKLIQVMMLSHALKGVLDEASMRLRAAPVQLLLCGDFNSLPDSGVIEFLSSGRVLSDHQDFKDLPYKSVLQKISGCDKPNEFTHSFKLASAYSEDIMPYTNYTFHFKGIIDYIFYSKQSMTPLGLLGPLAPEWLRDNKVIGCPHPHIPSDHFPLLVELEMMPSTQTNGIIPSNRR